MTPILEWLPWALAACSAVLLLVATALSWRRRRHPQAEALPLEWALTARPVFSADERRVYRQLREALPHHIVLSKLPLVRFCQPNDPQETRYWFQLLGAINVTFAVCSANGRVLAAIDLESDHRGAQSRRALQIKQAVLGACRVRYLRCPADHLPSIPELQLLVPHSSGVTRAPHAAPTMHQARDTLTHTVASRRRQRQALWQDSSVFHDSFFGTDSRPDLASSEFDRLRTGSEDSGLGAFPSSVPPPPLRH